MKRLIGITGGVGAGKSQVLQILKEEFGARVILTDQVARRLMEKGKPGWQKVREALGEGILGPDGSIDRKSLAARIFSDDRAREQVDSAIHPMVWEAAFQEACQAPEGLAVIESALMKKEQLHFFDEVWYVYTSEEERIRRLMRDRGYTREKSLSVIKSQASDREFRELCSQVIDNNGSVEETRKQIRRLLNKDKEKGQAG